MAPHKRRLSDEPVYLHDPELEAWWLQRDAKERIALMESAISGDVPPSATEAWIRAAVLDAYLGRRMRLARTMSIFGSVAFVVGFSLYLFAPSGDLSQLGFMLAFIPLFSGAAGVARLYWLDRQRRDLLARSHAPVAV